MKNNLFSLEGKSIKEIVDYADNLFRGDINKKMILNFIIQFIKSYKWKLLR